jgi:hypothetical protein
MSLNVPSDVPPAIADVENTLTFDGLSTKYIAKSTARATNTELGVYTSLSLTDFNDGINGQINQSASARYLDTFTIEALNPLYLSPIFFLDGDLVATPGIELDLTMNLLMSTVGVPGTSEIYSLVDEIAPLDGSTLPFSDNAAPLTPYSASPGSSVQVDVKLTSQIQSLDLSSLTNGASYSALADFYSTSTFLGFAVFEDEAMTIPVTSGVTITSDSTGETIPVNPVVVPIPSAVWLFGSGLLGLVGISRRKKAA